MSNPQNGFQINGILISHDLFTYDKGVTDESCIFEYPISVKNILFNSLKDMVHYVCNNLLCIDNFYIMANEENPNEIVIQYMIDKNNIELTLAEIELWKFGQMEAYIANAYVNFNKVQTFDVPYAEIATSGILSI